MSSENLHAPREVLSQETRLLHNAITSLIEELEAVDWFRQRADDTEDDALREILLHNMREEMEHGARLDGPRMDPPPQFGLRGPPQDLPVQRRADHRYRE